MTTYDTLSLKRLAEKNETRHYRESQFNRIGTEYSEFSPKIKIIKPNGETNWLDITEAELKKIKAILLK